MSVLFDLQGHRGARGLRPENTLPSFEAALDAGVTTIETDLHLTRDNEVVLWHDPRVTAPLCSLSQPADVPPLSQRPLLRHLTLPQLRHYRAAGNADAARFPHQEALVGPVSRAVAEEAGTDPFAIPTLAQLFRLAAGYAGEMGRAAGKSEEQQLRASRVRFDLELKRIPFHPETIGDGFDGKQPGVLEEQVVAAVQAAAVAGRTIVRSFDHRCVQALAQREPALRLAVLVADTAPVDPAEMARSAGASIYCPSYVFLDADLVRRAQDDGVAVVPWTVNDPAHWQILLDWGVDGMTTDYPDRLADYLRQRGISF